MILQHPLNAGLDGPYTRERQADRAYIKGQQTMEEKEMAQPKNTAKSPQAANNSEPASSPEAEKESAAKHYKGVTKGLGGISWRFLIRLKWQYLPMLLSDFGREIVRRKYDAIATDKAYENAPSGLLGPLGTWVDHKVLELPLHQDLRHRLRFVVDALKDQSQSHALGGNGAIKVLSAPCGLTRDILTARSELSIEAPDVADRLELHALDLDPTGEVIPIARRRKEAAGIDVSFYRADLFNPESVKTLLSANGRFHIVNCIGLTPWITLEEVEYLFRFFHDQVLIPGGTLVIDNFTQHEQSSIAEDLEIHATYHDPGVFVAALEANGFRLISSRTTAHRVNTVYVASSVSIP